MINKNTMNISPVITQLEDMPAACVSFTGDYRGKPQVFAKVFGQLLEEVSKQDLLQVDSVMLSAYNDDPSTTPPEELSFDACVVTAKAVQTSDRIQAKTLPGGTYAVASIELSGPEEYGVAWKAMVDWIEASEYEWTAERPWYEIYKNKPEEHPEGHHILDMCAAVK